MAFLDADGDVIVEVPFDLVIDAVTAAEEQAQADVGGFDLPADGAPVPFQPDNWLVASIDGLTWHAEDLPDADGGFGGQTAVNGSTVVLRTWDGEWHTFTIG